MEPPIAGLPSGYNYRSSSGPVQIVSQLPSTLDAGIIESAANVIYVTPPILRQLIYLTDARKPLSRASTHGGMHD